MAKRIRSRWTNQFTVLPENSKLHNHLREIFASDATLSSFRCYQEVPVIDLCPDYPNPSHRFDWFIEELNLIVEVHGRQHYQVTNRGNLGLAQAEREFVRGVDRDNRKQEAALRAGYAYIAIPYKGIKKLTSATLKELLFQSTM